MSSQKLLILHKTENISPVTLYIPCCNETMVLLLGKLANYNSSNLLSCGSGQSLNFMLVVE